MSRKKRKKRVKAEDFLVNLSSLFNDYFWLLYLKAIHASRKMNWEKTTNLYLLRQKFHISLQHEYRCFVKYPLITWNRKFLKLSRWFSLIQMPKLVMFNVSSVQTVSIRLTRDYREHLTVNKFSFCTSSLKKSNSVSLSKLCFLPFTTERNMQIGTACTKNNNIVTEQETNGLSCLTSSVVWLCLNAVPSDTDLFITFQNRHWQKYI